MSEVAAKSLRARFVDGMSHAAATVDVVTTDGPPPRYRRLPSAAAPSDDPLSPEFSSEYPPMQATPGSGIIPTSRYGN